MADFFENVGKIKCEDKDSFKPVSFEEQGAECLGKKILTGELNLDSLLRHIVDDANTPVNKSVLYGNMLCL